MLASEIGSPRNSEGVLVMVMTLRSVDLVVASGLRQCAFGSSVEQLRVRRDCPPLCAMLLRSETLYSDVRCNRC